MRNLTVLLVAALVGPLAGCCCPTTCCPSPCVSPCCSPCCAPCCDPCCPPPCAPVAVARAPVAVAKAAAAPASGGLLGDTSAFTANPERPGTWGWTKPGVDLRGYDDLLIEEVRVQPVAGSAFAAMDEAARAEAAAGLRAALLGTVGPYYDVVEAPGAHTLRVRVALTSVPGADGSGAASLEAELLDGKSEERLVAVIGGLPASEMAPGPEDGDVSATERSHRAWARRLLRYLDTHVR